MKCSIEQDGSGPARSTYLHAGKSVRYRDGAPLPKQTIHPPRKVLRLAYNVAHKKKTHILHINHNTALRATLYFVVFPLLALPSLPLLTSPCVHLGQIACYKTPHLHHDEHPIGVHMFRQCLITK